MSETDDIGKAVKKSAKSCQPNKAKRNKKLFDGKKPLNSSKSNSREDTGRKVSRHDQDPIIEYH